MDIPNARKIHSTPTPLAGGILLIGVFLPAGVLQIMHEPSARWTSSLCIWLACIGAMAIIGIADDRHTLSPRARLCYSFLVFGVAAAIDPTFNVRVLDFEYLGWSLGLGTWWLAVIFTVICCVGLVNAVNMADGKNGLVLGLSLGWLAMLYLRAPEALSLLIILLAIVLFVLFLFNMNSKLFLGDGGAYGIACAVGLLSIMVYNSPGTYAVRATSAEELVLLFIVPVFDSFRLTYRRLRQGRSPMSADRDHLHHHLQERFGWPSGLLIYWLVSLVPAATFIIAQKT
jgi:UDP-GlcNAc:undecaprenyl-phosphate/decaprenyl-phosphate GlcNAc-1-phosphate transferase